MIYTVTANPCIDYQIKVECFHTNHINRAESENMQPGGKGINVSIALHALGVSTTALGFVGGFTGEYLEKELTQIGVSHEFTHTTDGFTRINVKVYGQEETQINGMGPQISTQEQEAFFMKLHRIENGDVLILSGSLAKSLSVTFYQRILSEVKDRNVKVIVDTTNEALLLTLPLRPFLIKPNQHELGELFDVTIKNRHDAVLYAEKLRHMGAKNVLVSLGGEGAIFLCEDGWVYDAKAPDIDVKNTIGAGDSMVAGFVLEYIKSYDYCKAFLAGLCTGSASASLMSGPAGLTQSQVALFLNTLERKNQYMRYKVSEMKK